jgi:hypothetical protein
MLKAEEEKQLDEEVSGDLKFHSSILNAHLSKHSRK